MGNLSREKGKRFEQELARDFREAFGIVADKIRRCWERAQRKGHDLDVPGFAVEAKRYAKIAVYPWMAQAIRQAEGTGLTPVLIVRADHKDALVIMRLSDWVEVAKQKVLDNCLGSVEDVRPSSTKDVFESDGSAEGAQTAASRDR